MEDDNKNKSWKEHINEYLLKLSSTKLGQTDFDPNKDYYGEEPPMTLKKFGLLILGMLGIVLIAIGVMLLFTNVNYYIAIGVVGVIAIICTIVIMHFRK